MGSVGSMTFPCLFLSITGAALSSYNQSVMWLTTVRCSDSSNIEYRTEVKRRDLKNMHTGSCAEQRGQCYQQLAINSALRRTAAGQASKIADGKVSIESLGAFRSVCD